MDYSKEHKTVLQAVIHEGALHEDRVKEFIIRLFGTRKFDRVNNRVNKRKIFLFTIKTNEKTNRTLDYR